MVVPWAACGDTADAAFRPNPAGKPMAGALLRCRSLIGLAQPRSRRLALHPAIGFRTSVLV